MFVCPRWCAGCRLLGGVRVNFALGSFLVSTVTMCEFIATSCQYSFRVGLVWFGPWTRSWEGDFLGTD